MKKKIKMTPKGAMARSVVIRGMKEFNNRFTEAKINASIDAPTRRDRHEQGMILAKIARTVMQKVKTHIQPLRKEKTVFTKAQLKVVDLYQKNVRALDRRLNEAVNDVPAYGFEEFEEEEDYEEAGY
jgi:hypothetical protein